MGQHQFKIGGDLADTRPQREHVAARERLQGNTSQQVAQRAEYREGGRKRASTPGVT
ncbi:MAG: hypothetical protein R3B90_17825 [Planctomycetaceae bacterium]